MAYGAIKCSDRGLGHCALQANEIRFTHAAFGFRKLTLCPAFVAVYVIGSVVVLEILCVCVKLEAVM